MAKTAPKSSSKKKIVTKKVKSKQPLKKIKKVSKK